MSRSHAQSEHPLTVDAVLILPARQRHLALHASALLADRMDEHGGARFRLGVSLSAGTDSVPEPHVSLFMMALDADDIDTAAAALAAVASRTAAVDARGMEYRFNKEGAPEVFYHRADDWRRLQRAVVSAVEPLRHGRIREFGPGGERLADVLAQNPPDDQARIRQLQTYGFDDVSDDRDDRFNPHVTLTWPCDESVRVDLSGLPEVTQFGGVLADLALYVMGPKGTCVGLLGHWTLTAPATGNATT